MNRWQPENVLRALDTGVVDAVQVVYNIFDQAPEDRLFPACRARGVAVIARVPFDEGTLTGTLTRESRWPDTDWRSSYFTPAHLEASVSRAERLAPLVPPGTTMPELALRFILSSPDVVHGDPGHAQGAARGGEPGGERSRAAARRPPARVARAPLGPHAKSDALALSSGRAAGSSAHCCRGPWSKRRCSARSSIRLAALVRRATSPADC